MSSLLQHLLESTARRWPNKDAIVQAGASITFAQLNKVSNQFAYLLHKSGIQTGDRVGLYLNKSIQAIIGIFGILKAGAAYVPLDSSAPVSRVARMASHCELNGLVADGKRFALLKNYPGGLHFPRCVVLTDESAVDRQPGGRERVLTWEDVLSSRACSPAAPPLSENGLAYILYTSGSTGSPKGVMISHRASLAFIDWSHDCFQVRPGDRVSNHAPLHFDLSIFDIFTSIKAGATLVLVPPQFSAFPINLAHYLREQRITIWYSVPSALIQLVLHGNLKQHRPSDLRKILFAGEVFPVKFLRALIEQIPQGRYFNLYGPTETNVCTYYPVDDLTLDQYEQVPIGKACSGTHIFALKDRRELTRAGEVGELYVRGNSLMTGYWKMPEETQRVLVPDPTRSGSGQEIVYRTGDWVRQAQDGNYLFHGRIDSMIKSRGYRIELGEIESTLYDHPDVQEAAVVAIPDELIGNQIKAIIVPRSGLALPETDVEYFCSTHLPKYMIPSLIEVRSSMPRTATGKIDKALLRNQHLQAHSTS